MIWLYFLNMKYQRTNTAGVQRCALKCKQTDKESDRQTDKKSDRQTKSHSDVPIDTKTCSLMVLYILNAPSLG